MDTRRLKDHDLADRAWRALALRGNQLRRLAQWTVEEWPAPVLATGDFPFDHARLKIRVNREDPDAHPLLEEGKRVNIALAAPRFDGLLLSPERPLSLQRVLGRITAARGFRPGMELRGGCIVPSLGGGICLLSNSIFAMAARLGWTILERHGHTAEAVPLHEEPWGLDATLAWPHVDLRVAPPAPVRLGVRVEGAFLRIDVDGSQPLERRTRLWAVDEHVREVGGETIRSNRILREIEDPRLGRWVEEIAVNRKRLVHGEDRRRNCLTCGEAECSRRESA